MWPTISYNAISMHRMKSQIHIHKIYNMHINAINEYTKIHRCATDDNTAQTIRQKETPRSGIRNTYESHNLAFNDWKAISCSSPHWRTFGVRLLVKSPRAGSGVVRMDPLRFLAGCRTRRLNQSWFLFYILARFLLCWCLLGPLFMYG